MSKILNLLTLSSVLFLFGNSCIKFEKLDTAKIEKLIWEKTNEERKKAGANTLGYEDKIAQIARNHSKNMAENNFFDHINPQKLAPSDRIAREYKSLFITGSGENIAINFGKTNEQAAENLMTAWMNSPGHKRNILMPNFTYIGVGVYIKGQKIYATQNFARPVVLLEKDLPAKVKYGQTINPVFKFYPGVIDKNKLTLFVKFPDLNYRFRLSDNYYFRGEGKYFPKWLDDNHFNIGIRCDKGLGDYSIRICEDNTCYETVFKTTVIR